MHKKINFVRSFALVVAVVVATTIGQTNGFAQEKRLPKVAEAVRSGSRSVEADHRVSATGLLVMHPYSGGADKPALKRFH